MIQVKTKKHGHFKNQNAQCVSIGHAGDSCTLVFIVLEFLSLFSKKFF